jgi:phosphopantetheinyl transferase
MASYGWTAAALPKTLALLPESRAAKAARLKLEADKCRSILAGLLLAFVCGAREDGDLEFGPHGRPELSSGAFSISLSHSGDFAALAVCGQAVGVDLEQIKERHPSLAERVLTKEEKLIFEASGRDPALFAALWTRKESLGKASGLGFSLDAPIPALGAAAAFQGKAWALWSGLLPGAVLSAAAEIPAPSEELARLGEAISPRPEVFEVEPELAQWLDGLL